MTNAQQAWKDLGDRLEALGLKLQLHLAEEGDATAAAGDSVRAGLVRVGKALEEVFEAIGDAADDDAVRADAKDAGRLLLDAVDATLTEAGEVLRNKIRGS